MPSQRDHRRRQRIHGQHCRELLEAAGARVVLEQRRGYGYACAAGAAAVAPDVDVVVFMDGDGSDEPSYLSPLLEPLRTG